MSVCALHGADIGHGLNASCLIGDVDSVGVGHSTYDDFCDIPRDKSVAGSKREV